MEQTWGVVLIIYGIVCAFILIAKPPMIWNMKKFKVMIDMMGKKGFTIFLTVWTLAAFGFGIWLYNM
jgi:hypothetical protein